MCVSVRGSGFVVGIHIRQRLVENARNSVKSREEDELSRLWSPYPYLPAQDYWAPSPAAGQLPTGSSGSVTASGAMAWR